MVAIVGSRGIRRYSLVGRAVTASGWRPTKVVTGGAPGVDTLAERWAKENSVPCEVLRADWKRFGKSAGYRRNVQVVGVVDAVVAIWDGKSKGTQHTIEIARTAGKPVFVLRSDS